MLHQIGSRTPRRDTYVGFCLYEEEEEVHPAHIWRSYPFPGSIAMTAFLLITFTFTFTILWSPRFRTILLRMFMADIL